ncbi:MAG: ATP-binding protein [Candidatus Caldatribacterium sp.]|nr:ATP-binding protein [Candidatus Caldatribacterium sp.]
MAVKGLKRVWEVCEPHPDVFSRDPDPSLFAISLHHVVQGSADRDYTDPERFFNRTYMTRALSDLLERVIGRLAGMGRGAPILRLETPFGGGKTHTITALYHLARYPEAVSEHETIRPILERLNLRELPKGIRIAVLDGRGLDVRERRADGIVIRTLWGELAYQLGSKEGYEVLADADETRTAPGSERLTEFLQRYQPVLILVDELLEYLVKARAVKVGDSNLMEQTATFFGALTAAVSAVPRSVLIAALPASSLEVPMDDQTAAERLFQQAKKVLGRVELIETPVAQDEVFGVLRRRLFQSVGNEREHRKATEAMQDYYAEYARFFPDRLRSPDYRARMLQAYPFHPELVDLLYKRWGPHPQFQRTRGALRLLALVLRRLWNQRPGSALLIQPHHIDLADRHIRGEVIRLLDSGMDAIVTGDILQRAVEIERQLGGEYAREELGKGAAACAFLYSISAATREVGATEEEIRTALLRPDINPAMASEVLGRLREGLWYLRYRDRRYLFTAKPNLNKVILDFENEITEEQVDEGIRNWLEKVAGRGVEGFQVIVAPAEPQLVPDRAQPTLVILPTEVDDATAWMQKALQLAGDGIRTNKNMLVFLVPEQARMASLRTAVRRWLALKEVERSHSFKELDAEDKDQVREQLKDKEAEIETLIKQAYQDIYRPGESGFQKIASRSPEAIRARTLDEFATQVLKEKGELTDRVAPEFLKEVLSIDQQKEVPVAQAMNLFTGTPGQPLLTQPQQVVAQTIKEGVAKGQFGLKVGERVYVGEEVPDEVLRDSRAVLISPELPPSPPPEPPTKPIRLRVHTSTKLIYPLLVVAKQLANLDASVLLEIDDPTGKLAEQRTELEKLLRDYGCSWDWDEKES